VSVSHRHKWGRPDGERRESSGTVVRGSGCCEARALHREAEKLKDNHQLMMLTLSVHGGVLQKSCKR
jgi:hypothetical protein